MHLQTYESEDFERNSVKGNIFRLDEKKTRETKYEYIEFELENNQSVQSFGPSQSGIESSLAFDQNPSEEIEAPVQPSPASPQKKYRKNRSLAKQKTNPEATLNRCSDDSNKQQREISTSLSNLPVLSRELSTNRPAGNNVSRS
jgi:hypothetical protein